MGARKLKNKHGVGVLGNKKWRKRPNWTDYISERAISTSITVNKRHVLLMSVYFPHSGYADHHVEKVYRSIEKLTKSDKKNIQVVGGDFNAESGPGFGVERVSVGPHTLKEGNKRGDWITKLHSTQHDVLKNKLLTGHRKVQKKQLDYVLVDRKHMHCSRDAEANDMIHMGSDHRCVMGQFVCDYSTKEGSLTKNAHCQAEK